MDELRSAFAYAMASDQLAGRAIEDQIDHAVPVAEDLAPGVVAEEGAPHDDFHATRLCLSFTEPHAAHLGDRVNAVRQQARDMLLVVETEGTTDRHSRLLHRGRCERGEPDDIPGRIDARRGGPELVIDHDVASLIGLDPDLLEVQMRGVPAPPRRDQHLLAFQHGARSQAARQASTGLAAHLLGAIVQVRYHPKMRHRSQQSIPHLVIQERQQGRSAFYQVYLDAQGREHGRVLATDDTAAQNRE